ncbi:MAG: carboxymuconolactone decarboxylase family protein [Rhodospirillaceae bacterium]
MKPEPHFKRVARDDLPERMQPAWDNAMEMHGDATFTEVFGNAPHMYDWYMNDFYKKVFYSGRIERSLIELVRLRLANIHGCAHCNRSDKAAARAANVSEEQIDGLDDYETGPFSEKERAALALADVMVLTNPNGSVTKSLHERCRQHFSDSEMLELGMIMAVLCGMAKFIFAYDLVEKEDYCPFIPGKQAAE